MTSTSRRAAVALLAAVTLTACSSTVAGTGSGGGSSADASGASSASVSVAPSAPNATPVAPTVTGTVDRYTLPELAAAKAIPGVVYRPEPDHLHVPGVVQYDTSPPTGGNHSAYWADCTGTAYSQAIANENAVHMLEHGAVWITYRAGIGSSDLAALKALVAGREHTALSPYPGLRTAVSVQAWNYQLFVDDATDARIAQFVTALRANPQTSPEVGGPCAQPTFKAHPSTFDHPLQGP